MEEPMEMKTYTVYTESGIYTQIRAYSENHAKKVVWKMTLGRASMADMIVVYTGTTSL